jgi:hypothetical protein
MGSEQIKEKVGRRTRLAPAMWILAALSCWFHPGPILAQNFQTRQGIGSEDPTLSDNEVHIVKYALPLMLIALKFSEVAQPNVQIPERYNLPKR